MRPWTVTASLLVLSGGVLAAAPAQAQLMDSLKGAAGLGQSGGSGGGLGGMSMPSVGSASSGNVAGVLQYCMRNNYLGGDSGAASTETGLLGKLGGGATSSSQYSAGSQGTLESGGQNVSLGGGGLKGKLTQKVCDQVLKHAKSLI